MRVALISGSHPVRYPSFLGHQIYARRHRLDYHLELAPFAGRSGYWHKVAALQAHLHDYDWVVWLDDDAFITDPDSDFVRSQIAAAEDRSKALVVAPSCPDELNGAWAAYNSGVLALRNEPAVHELLACMAAAPMAQVEAGWDHERLGVFTGGDQDALVWCLESRGMLGRIEWADPMAWNARPWHYRHRLDEHPVCHFPGHPDKTLAIAEFARRMGVGPALLEDSRYEVPILEKPNRQTLQASRSSLGVRRAHRTWRRASRRVIRKVRWVGEHKRWK